MHRPTARWERIAARVVCAAILVAAACAARFARADDPEIATEPGILLMQTGTVVEGRIMRSGNDYLVQKPGGTEGRISVPGDLVKFQCATIEEAYERLRRTAQRQDTAAAHVLLARWCVTNKLFDDARTELEDALALEPERAETREMLSRINDLLDPARVHANPPRSPAPAPPAPTRPAAQSESLGSLTREQAQQFTRRIQPILVNNCTLAGCHGGDSQTGFRLQRVTPGGDTSRLATERNLAEVLEQIDFKNPRSSPLVRVPGGSHGRRGRPALAGPRGGEQLDEIRRWVQTIAQSEAVRDSHHREGSGGAIQQASAQAERSPVRSRLRGAASVEEPREGDRSTGRAQSKDPFGVGGGADPFDPTEFNRGAAVRIPRR